MRHFLIRCFRSWMRFNVSGRRKKWRERERGEIIAEEAAASSISSLFPLLHPLFFLIINRNDADPPSLHVNELTRSLASSFFYGFLNWVCWKSWIASLLLFVTLSYNWNAQYIYAHTDEKPKLALISTDLKLIGPITIKK